MQALKVLPPYSIVHKQDWFTVEPYRSRPDSGDGGFLSRSFERHFNERPRLNHVCYLFLTKTTRERSRRCSDFSTLCRGRIVPEEIDGDTVGRFADAVEQFALIAGDSGLIRFYRLSDGDIIGTRQWAGILDRYFALTQHSAGTALPHLEDIRIEPDGMRIGTKVLCVHTLSDLDDLPGHVYASSRYDRLSTERSECRLSFAAPVGVMLPYEHIYNQYIFLDDGTQTLRRMEKTARNMQALSRYSRSNAINKEWLDDYLNEAHSFGLSPVRVHCNVMAWAEDETHLKRLRDDVGARLAQMECTPRHNTVDVPTLFWGAIPGGEGEFPFEETFYSFAPQALCFFSGESCARDSLSPYGIELTDRLSGCPIVVDINDEPMRRGIITNYNKFILGPSGSGKSFFVNHLARQYWEQGSHCVIIDAGNSYEGLCRLINRRTGGRDGIYYTYSDEQPISFNPFYSESGVFDIEKRENIKTLLMTLWKREDEPPARAEEVALSGAVNMFLEAMRKDERIFPSFDSFYEFVDTDYRTALKRKKFRKQDFDIDGFLNILSPYHRGGEYDYLLNSDSRLDLLDKRFIVFEIDAIRDHAILFPIVTIVIMDAFIGKMRRLKGVRKVLFIEEAWKALMKNGMADYVKFLYKTVRKYYGECITITQEIDDLVSSPIVKESIVINSDCKILLDQRKYINKFDGIQSLLGLTDKERDQILSINLDNDPARHYKEV